MRGSISVKGVYKGYSTRSGVLPAVDGIELAISAGEFVAIVGPSGCGKSTLLDILSGFQKPDRGEVLIDGQPLEGPSAKRILIPQNGSVFPWMTVLRNMTLVQNGRPEAEKRELALHYLELVRLSDFQHAFPTELSGGMLKRLELARALVVKPDILFMDEPFGSLDALTRLRVRNEMVRLLAVEHHTVILVTHDVEEALQLADRIVIFTPRPARIRQIIEVRFPQPRVMANIELIRLRQRILSDLGVDDGVQPANVPDTSAEHWPNVAAAAGKRAMSSVAVAAADSVPR